MKKASSSLFTGAASGAGAQTSASNGAAAVGASQHASGIGRKCVMIKKLTPSSYTTKYCGYC